VKKVAIITDSTACIPDDLVREYDFHLVPLLIIFEHKSCRDGVDITASEVYQLMRENRLPTTSTPPPGDFLEAYRQLSQKAEGILCITLSRLLSMAFDSAMQAKEMAKEELPNTSIEVFDSQTVAGAMGLIALEAARVASQGADLTQVVEAALNIRAKVNLIAVLDTLSYLARLGRVGTASAWVGSLLNIKPILEVPTSTGYTAALERPRTKARALRRLLEIMAARVGDLPVHVLVHHAGVPDEGEGLMAQVAAKFNCAELYLTEFTPMMGVHTGPGLLGLSFYADG